MLLHAVLHCTALPYVQYLGQTITAAYKKQCLNSIAKEKLGRCFSVTFSLNKLFIIKLFSITGESDQIELPGLLQGSHYHWKTATSEYGAEVPFRNISFPGSKLLHCSVTKNW